jgi:endonuclease G, mitochondrial
MMNRQIDLIRRTSANFEKALEGAREKLTSKSPLEAARTEGLAQDDVDLATEVVAGKAGAESLASPEKIQAARALEAIILEDLRPAWFIKNDQIEIAGNYDQIPLVEANLAPLSTVTKKVGRVDLFFHPSLDYAGTGWLVARDIAVTNRHVAEVFGRANALGRWGFARGGSGSPIEARIDYLHQHEQADGPRQRAEVVEILYVAGANEPDFAFLKIVPIDGLEPFEFAGRGARHDEPIAAIGYPAWDGERNDPALMDRLFGGIYDVKRFSPGLARSSDEPFVFEADYTSLGGNSGSAVISLDSGKALGLHFAGLFRRSNYAVSGPIVEAALRRLKTQIAVPLEARRDQVTSAQALSGRRGYIPEFLGEDAVVPFPRFGDWEGQLAQLKDGSGPELKYTHFSVIQCATRRLPLVTAVNIDGAQAYTLKREGTWKLDGRIELDEQIGNDLYAANPIDRGHLVRRMDPGWGETQAEAEQGEADTFHYTNSAPQHEDLNQKEWLGLEDYILGSTRTKDFSACILTGPVFREGDPKLKRQPGAEDIRIPKEYWKVAAMINADTGRLSVTGYVLSQGDMIADLTEAAFVYGKYKTYQVRLSLIEKATGLDFCDLKDFDPLAGGQESLFGEAALEVIGPDSLRL